MVGFIGIFVMYILGTLLFVMGCLPFTLEQSDDSRNVDRITEQHKELIKKHAS